MFFSIQNIFSLLIAYKYQVIFPIAIIEGPVISIISGSLAHLGYINIYFAYILLVLADLVGDTLYYAIGKFGGLYFIRRWNHILKINEKKVVSVERMFEHHGAKMIYMGKTHGLGSLVLMSAGLARYPYWKFIWYNMQATVVKTFVLLAVGYFFAQEYVSANSYVVKVGVVMTFVAITLVYFYIRRESREI